MNGNLQENKKRFWSGRIADTGMRLKITGEITNDDFGTRDLRCWK